MKPTTITHSRLFLLFVYILIISMTGLPGCASKKPEISQGTITPVNKPTVIPTATVTPIDKPTGAPAATVVRNRASDNFLPDPSYVTTLIRAPIAWQKSTGQGVSVAVIQIHNEKLDLVTLVAPDAKVVPFTADKQLQMNGQSPEKILGDQKIRLLVILQPVDFDPQALRQKVKALVEADIAVFINADLTPGENQVALVNDLEAAGAITVGQLSSWGTANGPDVTERKINLFAPCGWSAPVGNAAQTVAGVGALLLANDPQISVEKIKTRLVQTADRMWQVSDVATGQWNFQNVNVDPDTGDYAPNSSAFHFNRVNAASALGQTLDHPWPVYALNAPAAWEKATGRGVKVAVIDQGFHINNPAFQDRLVDKAAFVPGKDFSGTQNFHGTSMAKIVLSVAPEASLIFLLLDERSDQVVIDAYAKAIDYAIEHQVDIITSSAGPWPNSPEVHAAIDRAIQAGIVFVWFHYHGTNPAVIRPGHFWTSSWEVGAFDRFFDPDKPADLEGGLSDTAPQIAGVAALVLQNEPDLSPLEIKQRIIETAAILPNGCSLADADAAVNNRPSGRKLVPQPDTSAIHGQITVIYTLPNKPEKQALTIQNMDTETILPVLPQRNVYLYRLHTNQPDEKPADFLNASNADQSIGLGFYGEETFVTGEVKPSSLILMLTQENLLKANLSSPGTPAIQVEVNEDNVRLHWESVDGVPLQMRDNQTGEFISPPGMMIYQLDAEGNFLPFIDIFQPWY